MRSKPKVDVPFSQGGIVSGAMFAERRTLLGYTQEEAGVLIYRTVRGIQALESRAEIDPALWELFLIKTAGKEPKTAHHASRRTGVPRDSAEPGKRPPARKRS